MAWDTPEDRIRAYVRAMREKRLREKELTSHKLKLQSLTAILLRKTTGEPPTPQINVKTLSTDVSESEIRFFCTQRLAPGETVRIQFDKPVYHSYSAKVVSCVEIGSESRVISENATRYRVRAQLVFKNTMDRVSAENFKKALEENEDLENTAA